MFSKKIYKKFAFFLSCIAIGYNADCQLPKNTLPAPAITAANPAKNDSAKTDAFLEEMLSGYPQYFGSVLQNRKELNVQIIYSVIDRGINGNAAFKHYYFNVNPATYFNPAAAIQLPVSILTLQRLGELKLSGQPVDKDSTIIIGKAFSGQTEVINDPTTIDGQPTIGHFLKKALMANDSDAISRLYEFLGQQYISEQLRQKGYNQAQIVSRPGMDMTLEENRHTNPFTFLGFGNKILYAQPARYNTAPFAFTQNRISLEDLHNMLISLIFPNKVHAEQRFNLADADRKFLLKYMSQLPGESTFPPYASDSVKYFSSFKKYLLAGIRETDTSKNIRSFNSSGQANGQFTDIAYFADYGRQIEFLLSATVSGGKDQQNGQAFLQHLGEVIYAYELKRVHKIPSDLTNLKFDYDRK